MVFENDCLRGLAGKTQGDQCRKTYSRIVLGLDSLSILNLVKKCRLNWFGHVVKRGEKSHVYRTYKEDFPRKRRRGRPPNLPLLTLERIAKDRDRWKKCVKKKCARI